MSGSESRFVSVVRFAMRSGKRVAVSVVGGVLVLGGLAMLVLPGPGLLVVVAGFAVLGTEYAWAARALDRTKETAEAAGQAAKRAAGQAGKAAKGAAGSAGRAAKTAADTAGRAAKGAAGAAGRTAKTATDKVVRPAPRQAGPPPDER